MSAPLSKELREQYNVRRLPVVKGDTVELRKKNSKIQGTVKGCYRKKFAVYMEHHEKDTSAGKTVSLPVDASNLVITKLKLNADRKKLLARRGNNGAEKVEA
eukprot:CAMPEP_0117429152 /NCGR_PEP_ID=MMETSP0758-20121206/8719_1 /TAXON_ID=63605 /ORGANISM="Percolomonas cosmopolitus, Strain AE-1 (ATCC 50343)" /LENGTH=101 /DNA_ID=CAMNT_0005215941 /DNA_START=86 /DNA_END=391 /DNA_ORIENTATION=+